MPTKKIITIGDRFGRWTVIDKEADGRWLCLCDCGNSKPIQDNRLKIGRSKSCGCLRAELSSERRLAHGHTVSTNGGKSKIYVVWRNMLARCRNPRSDDYHNYGGRGITVCERWLKFEPFLDDMGEPPPGLTLDRLDSNGNYCKGNCAWNTPLEQGRNRRNVVRLTFQGQTLRLDEWAKQSGISRECLRARYFKGWSVERVLTQPHRFQHGT